MRIHEYQAQSLLARYGIPVLEGEVAETVDQAAAVYERLVRRRAVVKAQIHAGGRGKGRVVDAAGNEVLRSGVHIVESAEAVREVTGKMLGNRLVTHQTGPAGQKVAKVYVSRAVEPGGRELYLGIAVDRNAGVPVMMASSEGGVEIEQVARESAEKIFKEPIDSFAGLAAFRARRLAYKLGLGAAGEETLKQAIPVFTALARLFLECDCSLAEINPLVITPSGSLLALDAKINLDDNALFRHAELAKFHDPSMEDAREVDARQHRLSYVGLDGAIGCLVNGAGLAMATMDIIKHCGAEPANFLDVGGSATREMVTGAFKIILADARVKAILVNIFGGIAQCDVIAEGILGAVRDVNLRVPLVVRLEGSRSKEGRQILADSSLAIIPASSMADAAEKVVAAAEKVVAAAEKQVAVEAGDVSAELFEAIKDGDANRVTDLVQADPSLLKARSESNESAVLTAVYHGRREVLASLIAAGAHLDLFEASAAGRVERLRDLLRAAPESVNEYADDGWTPLHLAAYFGHEQAAEVLLGRGANMRALSQNDMQNTPLHAAAATGRKGVVNLLLRHGADPNARASSGWTALHLAASRGDGDVIVALLAKGADVKAKKDDGRTVLEIAREKGHDEVADLLRGHGGGS